ncbi:hypothetical protein K7X08_036573 [Anisodus acutangulus]|uniref:Glycosyl-hydrolase family 116 N-terminal domain-containing protein n=1 Tax=Anisodus acutangulus TaxID=402998 RepID=A0A9Q1QX01_9SOLA|nr:hypothetical protein K7X08_036573 [Anisodus acutangulus]
MTNFRTEDGVQGVLLHHMTSKELPSVTFAIAAEENNAVHVSDCPFFVITGDSQGITAKDKWNEVKKHGSFDHLQSEEMSMPSEPGSLVGAAVAASLTIPADDNLSQALHKVLWYMGHAAAKITHDAIQEHTQWESQIEEWKKPIVEDKRLPKWYPITLFNELYYLNAGGTIWTDGLPPVQSLSTIGKKFSIDRSSSDVKKSADLTHSDDTAVLILERMGSGLGELQTPVSVNAAVGTNLLQKGEENVGHFLYLEGIEYHV